MSAEYPGTLYLKRTLLIVEWPNGTQQKFPLTQDVTRFGRGTEDNDLAAPLDFKSISRRHFEIQRKDGGYSLQDLGSGNGVLVNGQLVDTILLKDADEIRVGMAEAGQEVRILFVAGTETQVRAAISEPGSQAVLARLSPQAPSGQPYMRVRLPHGQERFFVIQKDFLVIGRDELADLQLAYPFVSARHFELRRTGAAFTIRDMGSANGTLVNNQSLPALAPTLIHDQSIIRLGDESFGISLSLTLYNPLEKAAPLEGFSLSDSPKAVAPTRALVIGRADDCDIHLSSPDVSRKHAAIRRQGAAWILEDLGSVNGTFVNERQVKGVELREGSLIRIGSYLLVFQNGQVSPYQSNGMRLDVIGLSQPGARTGAQPGLEAVSFSVLPREFVSVVEDGTGNVLMNALVGVRPGHGTIKLNGHDFYRDYEHFRPQLGFVPQEDILHASLSVEMALEYAAQLRLPVSVGRSERQKRISAALASVSMNTDVLRRMRIRDLGPDQRKRVSIAAELLADPKLIYLEDACSGLDPGLEKKLMLTLRRMADEGRTVVLFTHAGVNTLQSDHVAFLAQGRLVYFGPSRQALDFFEVDEFADIYEKIGRSGDEWQKVYQRGRPEQYQEYVLDRQASAQTLPSLPALRFDAADQLRQFEILTRRALSVFLREPLSLALALLPLPLLGILQALAGTAPLNSFLFFMGLEAFLAGLVMSCGALVRERSIYKRERLANLRLAPYLASKVFLFSALAIPQVLFYLLALAIGVGLPALGLFLPALFEIFGTLFLTILAGILAGLFISALSRSTEMAAYLAAGVLFFQVFLGGSLLDLRNRPMQPLSYLSITRWSQTALGVSLGWTAPTLLCDGENNCGPYPGENDNQSLDSQPFLLLRSWLALGGVGALSLAAAGVWLKKYGQRV